MKRLVIQARMPGLNEIINARRRKFANGKMDGYNLLKKKWSQVILICARTQGFECRGGGHFTYVFREANKTRDPSNIAAGAIKLIEDGLQDAGLLENDGWKHIKSIHTLLLTSEKPSVTLYVTDEKPTEKEVQQWTMN